MTDRRTLKEFQQWVIDSQHQIDDWTNWLVQESQKHGPYKSDISWLKRNQPDMPNSYNATAAESFAVTVRNMYQEAINKVYKIALDRRPKDDK